MIEHYHCTETDMIKQTPLQPEFLKDLGTLTLSPIGQPTLDLLEHYEQSGQTCVEVSGLYYKLGSLN